MPTWAVYMWPQGPVGPVHSDTLFGAFCWAYRALHGKYGLERFLEGLPERPPCVVSSCFPVVRGATRPVRCYPMPFLPMPGFSRESAGPAGPREALREEMTAAEGLRGLAKAPFVSEGVFRDIVTQGLGLATLWDRANAKPPTLVRVAGVWMGAEEARGLPETLQARTGWHDIDIPRNHIDRIAGATVEGMLFSIAARYYQKDVGLWFALTSEGIEPFLPLLRYLQDTGVGGHRTSGVSQFAIPVAEIHELAIPSAPGGDRFVALSRYIPAPGEVRPDDERAAYHLVALQPKHESRGASPGQRIYKGRLLVLEEGSVLPFTGEPKQLYGQVVPVGRNTEGPDGFPVWHNGVTVPAFMAKERPNG